MYYQDQYGYPYQVGYYPQRLGGVSRVGLDYGKLLSKGAQYISKKATKGTIDQIKEEIRSEIRSGMIKMFLAGMAATVAGMFIYKGIAGGMPK